VLPLGTNSVAAEPEASSPYSLELDPIYTPPSNLPKIHSDPILPSPPRSSKWSLSFCPPAWGLGGGLTTRHGKKNIFVVKYVPLGTLLEIPEGGGIMCLRNVGIYQQFHTELVPRRLTSALLDTIF
jgi:hypothetical protein